MEDALSGFAPARHTHAKGSLAEEEAVRLLVAAGYEVIERNVELPVGEIDLVARDGETVCFVEIKARAGDLYGPSIGAVHAGKQRRITRAAALYLAQHGIEAPCRFDVLGLDRTLEGWEVTLVRDAFDAQW